jgi:hypothetical protein
MPAKPSMPKLSLDISKTVVFCIVFVAATVLVALGKIPPEWLEKLLLILIPSPIRDEIPDRKE